MPDGFTADVADIERAATILLPAISIHLATRAVRIGEPVSHGAAGPELANQLVFDAFRTDLADRLRAGRSAVDATAEALAEIAALYRRADGRNRGNE